MLESNELPDSGKASNFLDRADYEDQALEDAQKKTGEAVEAVNDVQSRRLASDILEHSEVKSAAVKKRVQPPSDIKTAVGAVSPDVAKVVEEGIQKGRPLAVTRAVKQQNAKVGS